MLANEALVLADEADGKEAAAAALVIGEAIMGGIDDEVGVGFSLEEEDDEEGEGGVETKEEEEATSEIGRASCRERG